MSNSWISILGKVDPALAAEVEKRIQSRIDAKEFSFDNQKYIEKVHFFPVPEGISVKPERLERLRTLCQLWDVRLRPREISSHRPVIGPVIVAVKKFLFPILQAFFKDALHQQRSFNAATLSLLAELSEEAEQTKNSEGTPKNGTEPFFGPVRN